MTVWGWFVVGLTAGIVHVLTQWWTVNRLHPGAPPAAVSWMIVGVFGRLTITAVLLLVALSSSITAGLLTFAGWWLGRLPLLIWWNR